MPRGLECGGEFVAIVERSGHTTGGLSRLVALACDKHDVAGLRPRDRIVNGLAAVTDLDHLRCAVRRARDDRRADGGGLLVARVVVGDYDEVGQLGGDPAHRFALAGVPVATGAEHHGQSRAALCSRSVCSTACNAPGLWA